MCGTPSVFYRITPQPTFSPSLFIVTLGHRKRKKKYQKQTTFIYFQMARRRNTKALLAVAIATSIAAVSYKLYLEWTSDNGSTEFEGENKKKIRSKYIDKSITLTLLHSVLNSHPELEELLLNYSNVTFILPPYLSLEDLRCKIHPDEDINLIPDVLLKNYRLLKCSNIDGYFQLLKNLKPDILLVCEEDLGITEKIPNDLSRFVGKIISIDQEKEKARIVLSEFF